MHALVFEDPTDEAGEDHRVLYYNCSVSDFIKSCVIGSPKKQRRKTNDSSPLMFAPNKASRVGKLEL